MPPPRSRDSSRDIRVRRRLRNRIENAQGHRETRRFHRRQHLSQNKVGFVVRQKVVFGDAIDAQGRNLEGQGFHIQANTLVLAENHGFAMDQVKLTVGLYVLFGKLREHSVVVDDAILENFDEGRAACRLARFRTLGRILC